MSTLSKVHHLAIFVVLELIYSSLKGNEEDYIIISLVRSRELGFLTNLRRTNVMLTRCKLGMIIVSSEQFLTGVGSTTLVGTLLEKMGPSAWLGKAEFEAGELF